MSSPYSCVCPNIGQPWSFQLCEVILPLSFLEIHYTVGVEATVPSTGACPDASGVKVFTKVLIDIIDCAVIIAL